MFHHGHPQQKARVKNAMISKLNDGSLDQVPDWDQFPWDPYHPGKVKL